MVNILSPVQQIQNLAKEKLEAFTATIRSDGTYKDAIYRGVRNTSQQIASDYGSRFLIELIQNAYDTHPLDRSDGQIDVLLVKEEGENGALYVANKGSGFSWNDVVSLCNIGTSNKPIGESIGNKGLGFRSARYVTDDPQIYSRSENRLNELYDGFCFRFARGNDFDELLADQRHCELAKKDIPFFHIPIPLTSQSQNIQKFARKEYSTVIRLPLRNKLIYQEIIKLLENIRSRDVPLLLFLQRIRTLEVVIQEEPDKSFTLLREHEPLILNTPSHTEDNYSRVSLENGEAFFIAWHMVPEATVKNAIDKSIEQGKLHQSWEDWKGDGELAVAVKLNGAVKSPRLYTFLPMGDQVECPFHGYLHGAFYPKADRTILDASIPVNSLYIDEAAKLCVRTILVLRDTSNINKAVFSQDERGTAIIDLLTWNQSRSLEREGVPSAPIIIRNAFLEQGKYFPESDILPVVNRVGFSNWATPEEVIRWDHPDLRIFGTKSLVDFLNVAILSPELSQERLDRLECFFDDGEDDLHINPSDMKLSEIAELVAIKILTPRSSKRDKLDYYLEFEKIFRNREANLSERKILYCSDSILRSSIAKEIENISQDTTLDAGKINPKSKGRKKRRHARLKTTTVFSPSRRSVNEAQDLSDEAQILQVPKELERNLAFLTDELDWYEELEEVRNLLEDRKLVQRYDAFDLITQVSNLSRNNRNQRTRQAALLWVFNLWLSYRKAQRSLSLRNVKLLVPTSSRKWIDADQAVFSAGWLPKTFGSITEAFLKETSSYSDELKQMEERLLAHKSAKPFSSKTADDWCDFLEAIGVRKGLQPIELKDSTLSMLGRYLNAESIGNRLQLNEVTMQYWQKDIDEYGARPSYQNSLHEFGGSLWLFPGQEQYRNFSTDAKFKYAQLILMWLEVADSTQFEVALFSQSAIHASRFNWPTPLAAFIRQVPWFPNEIQQRNNSWLQFQKPSEVWLPKEESRYLPSYMPGIPRAIYQQISTGTINRKLIDWCKVNVLDEQTCLPKQVWFLAKLFAEGKVDYYYLRSFLNLYHETWQKLASSTATANSLIYNGEPYLITEPNNQSTHITLSELDNLDSNISSVNHQSKEEKIYVRDTEENHGLELVAKQGFHIFDSGSQGAAKVAILLEDLLKEQYRAASEIQIKLLVDGEEYLPGTIEEDFAVKLCPWLTSIVYLSMESLTGMAAQHLPIDRSVIINRVNNIRLRYAHRVQYQVGDNLIELTDSDYGAIAFSDIQRPLLIIQANIENLTWAALANASTQFSQLLQQIDLDLPIKHCFTVLDQLQEPVSGPITDVSRGIEVICNEFHIDKKHAEKALEGLNNDISRLVRFLRPIVHYLKGIKDLEQFTPLSDNTKTIPELIEKMEPYFNGTGLSADKVVNVCQRAPGYGFIRDELEFSFGDFNRSLIAIGVDPDIHRDSHIATMRSFIAENKDEIMACLRNQFIDQFRGKQTLQEYVRYREEINTLQPSPEWLIDYIFPEVQMMEGVVNEWLLKNGATTLTNLTNIKYKLVPWYKVRNENKSRVNKMVQFHENTIKAWCLKNGVEPPEEWMDSHIADNISNELYELGALDFDPLEMSDLISWCVIAKVWPEGMPQTVELDGLGLNVTDLQKALNIDLSEKLKREKENRSIPFNGRQIDPQEIDNGILAKEIGNNLPTAITRVILGNLTSLQVMPELGTTHGSGRGRGKGKGGFNPRIPPEKTDLIGYLGECAVYFWLKRLLPRQDIDAAWVSTYKSRLVLGAGNNSLGYDFEISYRRQLWYLEVKSSLGDPQEFELGDTEVRKARDCAITRGTEYRIVYVSNVCDTKSMKIEILPNPLSEEGKPLFRIGGQGLRYQFSRER